MFKFGKRSRKYLDDAPDIVQEIMERAISTSPFDFCILCVYRGEKKQNVAYATKNSTKQWPDSIHNKLPSWAVDIARYYTKSPHIRWRNLIDFKVLFDHIKEIAAEYGIEAIWGADWDGDNDIYEHDLIDMPHIQFKKMKKTNKKA